jgi:hypothetical protein
MSVPSEPVKPIKPIRPIEPQRIHPEVIELLKYISNSPNQYREKLELTYNGHKWRIVPYNNCVYFIKYTERVFGGTLGGTFWKPEWIPNPNAKGISQDIFVLGPHETAVKYLCDSQLHGKPLSSTPAQIEQFLKDVLKYSTIAVGAHDAYLAKHEVFKNEYEVYKTRHTEYVKELEAYNIAHAGFMKPSNTTPPA